MAHRPYGVAPSGAKIQRKPSPPSWTRSCGMTFANAAPKLKDFEGGNADWSRWIRDLMERKAWECGGPWVTLAKTCRQHGNGTGEHGAKIADQIADAIVNAIMVDVYAKFKGVPRGTKLTREQMNAVTGTISKHCSSARERQTKTITLLLLIELALSTCQQTRVTSTDSKTHFTWTYPNIKLFELEKVRQMNVDGNKGEEAVNDLKELINSNVPRTTEDSPQHGSGTDLAIRNKPVPETATTDNPTTRTGGHLTFSDYDLTAWDQGVIFCACNTALESYEMSTVYEGNNFVCIVSCNNCGLNFKADCCRSTTRIAFE
jgi:hypothetical protein